MDMKHLLSVHLKNLWERKDMIHDEIIEEIRKYREEHAKKFNNDMDLIYQDFKKNERKSKREIVNLPAKRLPGTAES